MRKLCITVASIAMVMAAATAEAAGNVTVRRERMAWGWGSITLRVDGKPFAKLANAQSITFTLKPGEEHELWVKVTGAIQTKAIDQVIFEPKPGKHYYFTIAFDHALYRFRLRRDWNGNGQ